MDPAWNLLQGITVYTHMKRFRTLCWYFLQDFTSWELSVLIWNRKAVEASEWWASVVLVFVRCCCSVWPSLPQSSKERQCQICNVSLPVFLVLERNSAGFIVGEASVLGSVSAFMLKLLKTSLIFVFLVCPVISPSLLGAIFPQISVDYLNLAGGRDVKL